MSGLKLVLPTSFTDTTLPILRDDPVLSAGSLALIEPGHPANPFVGVPANASVVPNIAHAEAASVLALSDTGFGSVFTLGGSLSGAKGKIERTTKGGLHVIVSQSPGIAAGDGAKLDLASQIKQHLYANQGTHQYYFSIWNRLTRASIAGAGVQYEIGSGSNAAKMNSYRNDTGWGQNNTALPAGQVRQGASNTVGANFASMGNTPGNSNLTAAPGVAGPVWGAAAGTFNNAVGGWLVQFYSSVSYRFYVEDLTVSGRSYATVDALDYAEYQKQVLTAGGRYYGDTFTDPATIA